ncbi:MAG: hypothetical protein ACO1TE_23805 [Prosthecobacter sp.]
MMPPLRQALRFVAVGLLLLPAASWAQEPRTKRLNWKPTDFQPLTRLPWEQIKPNDTAKIMERIFREPHARIRCAVLGEYLREMPVGQLGMAFDLALMLEGRETPDDLVSQMLRIWAQRDPQAAWVCTQALAKQVGIEEGWLGYDSWYNDPITVRDGEGIKGARFWLDHGTLASFPQGVDASELPWAEKEPLLKAFTQFWFERFQNWPGGGSVPSVRDHAAMSPAGGWGVVATFKGDALQLKSGDGRGAGLDAPEAYEVGLRRWLVERPQEMPQILERIRNKHWPAEGQMPARAAGPSISLLLLWSQVDAAGMRAWATHVDNAQQDSAWLAKCILMAQVDDATRKQWLAEPQGDLRRDRLTQLASWQPEVAVSEALRSGDTEWITDALQLTVYGENSGCYNWSHFGLGYLRDFDLNRLPKEAKTLFVHECAGILMEQWGDVDVGECARFGLRVLPHGKWPERQELLNFFRGEADIGDDGIVDRTFCSLRVWAVVRPAEMRAWLGTLKDKELRESLTWLLEHPWGMEKPPAEKEEK